jgi:hypothetical protein
LLAFVSSYIGFDHDSVSLGTGQSLVPCPDGHIRLFLESLDEGFDFFSGWTVTAIHVSGHAYENEFQLPLPTLMNVGFDRLRRVRWYKGLRLGNHQHIITDGHTNSNRSVIQG